MRFSELIKETKLNGITIIDLEDFVEKGYPKNNVEAENPDMDDDGLEEGIVESLLAEKEFGLGASHRPISGKDLKDYLHRIATKTTAKRDTYDLPYIHGSNIVPIKNEEGRDYDLDALRDAITKRPTSLLKQNEKMKHSDGSATIYYNTSLPALKGLAVNEETGEFVIIDTCPGAGICKTYCYAKKGSYVMFKAVSMNQTRVLNFLMNDPDGFSAKLSEEIQDQVDKWENEDVQLFIRFHDSGDFFSLEYYKVCCDIARNFPTVKFYAYTKSSNVMLTDKPENFELNFSEGALPKEEKKLDIINIKRSIVVPKEMFFDLIARKGNSLIKDDQGRMQFIDEDTLEEFKQRLVEKYHIKYETILTYDEYIETDSDDNPEEGKPFWSVIVVPGDGDRSAADPNVLITFLLFH